MSRVSTPPWPSGRSSPVSAARRRAATAAAGRRPSPRVRAARGQPEDVRPADAPSHSIEPGWAGTPWLTTSRRLDSSATNNGSVGSVDRPPAVSRMSIASPPASSSSPGPLRPRPFVRHVFDRHEVEPRCSTLSGCSTRSAHRRRRGASPGRARRPASARTGDLTSGPPARRRDRDSAVRRSPPCDHVGSDLHATPRSGRPRRLTVEPREYRDRIDPVELLESRDRTWSTPALVARRSTRLSRSAIVALGAATAAASRRAASSSWMSPGR